MIAALRSCSRSGPARTARPARAVIETPGRVARRSSLRFYFTTASLCSRRERFHEFAALREVWVGACCEIETAGASLAGSKLRDAHLDASFARFRVLGCTYPADPF